MRSETTWNDWGLVLPINFTKGLSSEFMASVFEKLNLKNQQEIVVLHAPASFEPELARLPVMTIHHDLASVPKVEFFLAFVTRKNEVDVLSTQIAKRAKGDAIVWFAYPKGTSKKYTCDFNRDNGWDAMAAQGFETVRAVAIDEDWSALRMRRREFVKAK
jgi:hypothetical protein